MEEIYVDTDILMDVINTSNISYYGAMGHVAASSLLARKVFKNAFIDFKPCMHI